MSAQCTYISSLSSLALSLFPGCPVFNPFIFHCPSPPRYTDEVRKVIKSCYDEVWQALESRRDGLWAGIKALAEKKEMLGEELVSLNLSSYPACHTCCASLLLIFTSKPTYNNSLPPRSRSSLGTRPSRQLRARNPPASMTWSSSPRGPRTSGRLIASLGCRTPTPSHTLLRRCKRQRRQRSRRKRSQGGRQNSRKTINL